MKKTIKGKKVIFPLYVFSMFFFCYMLKLKPLSTFFLTQSLINKCVRFIQKRRHCSLLQC